MENPAAACFSSNVASCSASASYSAYDVFISHHGKDVKKTFASHLYSRLLDRGLKVFLDEREMEEGHKIFSQIAAAIREASVHIAIFSKNYAQSNWCLDELDLMTESVLVAKSRATILPVFFSVEPSVVRHTDKVGEYAEALRRHESKGHYDSNRIQKWRKALSYVANLSGFELKAFNGNEGRLLDKLLDSVCEKVAKPLLEGAKYPIGVSEKLKELEEIVLSVKTNVVGIVGIGGVGKTTLATAFFNNWRSSYSESSFLFDVREKAAKTSLNSVQSQLLKDLKHIKDIEIQNTAQGTRTFERHLRSCHALIIVDDVDDSDQLDALLPLKEILSPQSLILVTSRDKHVLESSGVSSIYNLKGLNTVQSNELFCSYAFRRRPRPPEFEDLVYRFVKACDGLPLSLRAFGAQVCGKDRCYWEECLDELHEIQPEKIQQRLRISYDSLDKKHQPIFLDIACCFIGEDRDLAIKLWGKVSVENLEDKCLLEVDSIDSVYKIKMHDQIRDLGRSIAVEVSMPRRLCHTTDNIDEWLEQLEQSSSVINEVRGIKMAAQPRCRYTNGEVKRKMSNRNDLLMNTLPCSETSCHKRKRSDGLRNLQFVAAQDGYLERILSRVSSPNLKWLRWHGCPDTRMPPWVPMKDLKVLEVFGKELKILWEHDKVPCQLRELDVVAPISGFPKSIGQVRYLEKITVHGSYLTIKTLPEEFCDLQFLKYFVLKKCYKLMSLPASFGKLKALEHLDLEYADSLCELPESFGDLSRLKYLSLTKCYKLTMLNGTFGNITTLEYLNLSCCINLRVLPSSFWHLSRLKHLSLKCCFDLTLSNGTFGNITTLEYLNLSYCYKVRELPDQVANQRHLVALHFRRTVITELPRGIGGYYSLEALSFGGDFLEELPPWLGDLKNLNELSVYWSPKLTRLPDSFEPFTRLRKLSLCSSGIEYLPQDFAMMNNLETLNVNGCPLRELPFKKMEGETRLDLNKLPCTDHKYMVGLTRLDLRHTDISELAFPMGVCPNLQHLVVDGCADLRQIGELCGLEKLQYLCLFRSPRVEALPNVKTLKALEDLIVCYCNEMKRIPGLEHVMSLKTLSIYHCPKLRLQGRGVFEQLQQRLQEGFDVSGHGFCVRGFDVQGVDVGELYENDGEEEDGVDRDDEEDENDDEEEDGPSY